MTHSCLSTSPFPQVRPLRIAASCTLLLLLSACGGSGNDDANPPAQPPAVAITLATSTVGAEGTTLAAGQVEMVIPPGALAAPRTIVIEKLNAVPTQFSNWLLPQQQVYRFTPEGTSFAADITLKLRAAPAVDPEDDIGVLWTHNGKLAAAPSTRNGDVVTATSRHFSAAWLGSWANISGTFWNTTKVALTFADTTLKAAYAVGAVEMALLCEMTGRGDEGEPTCPGPVMSDGKREPLCLGPLFTTGSIKLVRNERTKRCWQPLKPVVKDNAFSLMSTEWMEASIAAEHADRYQVSEQPSHGTLELATNGSYVYKPAQGYVGPDRFSVIAVNEVGASVQAVVDVTVTALPPPVVTVTAMAGAVLSGSSTAIIWNATHSTSCVSSGSGGTGNSGQFTTPALTATTTYTVTCTGPGGSASGAATVTVNPATTFWGGRFVVQKCVNTAGNPDLPGGCNYTLTRSGRGAGTVSVAMGTTESHNVRWDYEIGSGNVSDACRSNSVPITNEQTEFVLPGNITGIWDHVPRQMHVLFKVSSRSSELISGTFSGDFTARPDTAESGSWTISGTWEMGPRGPFPKCTAIIKPTFQSGTDDGCQSSSSPNVCNWRHLRDGPRPGEWIGLP